MEVTSGISRRYNVTENSLDLWSLHSFYHLSHKIPSALGPGVVLWLYPLGLDSTTLHFCGFCSGLCLLQREVRNGEDGKRINSKDVLTSNKDLYF